MPTPNSFIPGPVQVRRRRGVRFGPPPVNTNHIVRVTFGDEGDRLVVTLSQPMTSFDEVSMMLSASITGIEVFPWTLNNEDPLNIVFLFVEDVSTANLWRVPGAGNWHFADGEPLVEPWSGSIS